MAFDYYLTHCIRCGKRVGWGGCRECAKKMWDKIKRNVKERYDYSAREGPR